MPDQPKTDYEVVAAVLADHVRGNWSDRTYSCQGCSHRTEAQVEERWPDAVDDAERRELRTAFHRANKPNWTLADYNAHVAEQVVAALSLTSAFQEPQEGMHSWTPNDPCACGSPANCPATPQSSPLSENGLPPCEVHRLGRDVPSSWCGVCRLSGAVSSPSSVLTAKEGVSADPQKIEAAHITNDGINALCGAPLPVEPAPASAPWCPDCVELDA